MMQAHAALLSGWTPDDAGMALIFSLARLYGYEPPSSGPSFPDQQSAAKRTFKAMQQLTAGLEYEGKSYKNLPS
jgi:hypothetical protein